MVQENLGPGARLPYKGNTTCLHHNKCGRCFLYLYMCIRVYVLSTADVLYAKVTFMQQCTYTRMPIETSYQMNSWPAGATLFIDCNPHNARPD
jgi:hypothetical protein